MLIDLPKLRCFSLALAVFLAASLVRGSASAACPSMPDGAACQAVCGCCKVSDSVTPSRATADPVTGYRHFVIPSGNNLSNGLGCVCNPQSPAAPAPKGHARAQKSPDSARDRTAPVLFGLNVVARPSVSLIPPPHGPSLQSPLYLRTSRILI